MKPNPKGIENVFGSIPWCDVITSFGKLPILKLGGRCWRNSHCRRRNRKRKYWSRPPADSKEADVQTLSTLIPTARQSSAMLASAR